jgi:hypothetical protein
VQPCQNSSKTHRFKELAEDEIYFAKRDQELIHAWHNTRLAAAVATRKNRNLASTFEKQYRNVNRVCRKEPLMLIRAIRRLVDRILVAFHLVKVSHQNKPGSGRFRGYSKAGRGLSRCHNPDSVSYFQVCRSVSVTSFMRSSS